jgi:hypothetical protein
MATQWESDPRGYDKATIGRYVVIVWTGSPAVDLDDGLEVCETYIPVGDREYPDGLMIVGRRRLDTRDRGTAREMAIVLASAEIAYREERRHVA